MTPPPTRTLRRNRSPDRARAVPLDDADARIAAIAARQHGVVSREQLLSAGITPSMIDYRVSRGRLHPMLRGVYRVGPIEGQYAREMAAVLASGPGALLSHLSAAVLWALVRQPVRDARLDVTTLAFRAPASMVRLHRTRALHPDDVANRHGIPVTSAARTLVDIAGGVDSPELERAVSVAQRSGLTTRTAILQALERHPRRRGSPVLRSLVDGDPALTRSEAEERFVALVRQGGLPVPEVNAVLHGYEVDCVWRAEKVVVEIDGYAFHGSRAAFERDRQRDAALMSAGFRVMRFSWRQITRTSHAVVASLAQTLASGRSH